MCFGSKSSSPAVPAPTPPTTFQPMPADTSNQQQRKAAVLSSSANPTPALGSDLGSGGTTPTTTTGGM